MMLKFLAEELMNATFEAGMPPKHMIIPMNWYNQLREEEENVPETPPLGFLINGVPTLVYSEERPGFLIDCVNEFQA